MSFETLNAKINRLREEVVAQERTIYDLKREIHSLNNRLMIKISELEETRELALEAVSIGLSFATEGFGRLTEIEKSLKALEPQ